MTNDFYRIRRLSAAAASSSLARRGTGFLAWIGRDIPGSALAASVAAAALLALITVPNLQRGAEFETATGEVRTIALADGSVVTLGAASEIEVAFSDRERRIELASGQAFFEVAHDPARPFHVDAGAATVRALGAKFDVNRSASRVRVAVLEGVVRLKAWAVDADSGAAHILRADQRMEAPTTLSASVTQSLAVIPVETAAPGEWRQGRLEYENSRLADLVADVNRYYAPGVELDEGARDVRVTASFRADEIPVFLNTLEAALPLSVEQEPDARFRIAARPAHHAS